MNRQNEAALMAAIRDFLRTEGMIAEARRLPAIAPQAAQSGNPTPQDVAQTLGPQPGERRNRTRDELGADMLQGAGSLAASAADPLGIPSAVTGLFSPELRDSWREYQAAAGPEVQIAGSLLTGFPAAAGMMRVGNALAGTRGMIAGGAATGASPTIDYAGDPQGFSGVNAMIGPLAGAALPAGMAAASPVMNAMRSNPLAASAGGAAALTAGSAVAQQANPPGQLDPFTQNLHANNPALAAAYQRMLQARQNAAVMRDRNIAENAGKLKNTGAQRVSERADTDASEASTAYETLLQQATDRARAENPTFREAMGPTVSNRLIRSTVLPFGLGLIGGTGAASLGRVQNAMARREIAAGNRALETSNIPAAATASANANALAASPGGSSWLSPGMLLSGLFGGEAALMSNQWNQDAAMGSPEQLRADRYFDTARPAYDFGLGALMGMSAYKGGRELAGGINNILPGRNRVSARNEAVALQRRVDAAPAAPQQSSPPPIVPPVPPVPPAGNQPPIDYQTMLNQIGARPLPPVAANTNVARPTNAGASLYQGDLQANIRGQIARQLQRDGRINLDMLQSAMERSGIMPGVIARARTAAEAANTAIANGATPQAVAAALRRGGIENLSVIGAAGAAGVAAHHSASQPRGVDGRFESAE